MNAESPRALLTEAQFNELMEQIDEHLRRESAPVIGRPLQAVHEAFLRLKLFDLQMFPPPAPAQRGLYTAETLTAHVLEWCRARYGDRLKTDLSPGSFVWLICGDPWRVRLPYIVGDVQIVCVPDLKSFAEPPKKWINADPVILNVLNCVEHLPSAVVATLTAVERAALLRFFVVAHEAMSNLLGISEPPLVPKAREDLGAAVMHLMSGEPGYGMARWASLQAVEKLMKAMLHSIGPKPKRTHDLMELASVIKDRGIADPDIGLVHAVQCSASVRYGEERVALADAIRAHHASIELCRMFAPRLHSRFHPLAAFLERG